MKIFMEKVTTSHCHRGTPLGREDLRGENLQLLAVLLVAMTQFPLLQETKSHVVVG
jgi:hypothetical protein